ncbi:hypothetical protein K435DRAFT_784698 [Dendrothele bispora CBS 962.96]|uniref:DUF6534 domain-containing protein n=1 Tax=Dendrothele bispora (strain CBS 962.96) TaxID=1314807 RepID=A0A4S8L1G0_DENBC|nr:hypothetical protein K435DRAFT_784698 [Dendrothele bispora CBS 962.96]
MSETLPERPTPITPGMFASSYGGILICGWFTILFYGMALLQTYMYFLRYRKDNLWLKLLVSIVSTRSESVLNELNSIPYSYADPSILNTESWTLHYLAITTVQMFFARMIFQLLKGFRKWLLVVGLVMFIISEFGWIVKQFQSTSLSDLSQWLPKVLVPLRILRMLSDAATTLSLCLTLFDAEIHFKPSIKLVRTIIIYAINRFILTTIVNTVETIVMIVQPDNTSILSVDSLSVNLYINSLLATLNTRDHVRAIGMDVTSFVSLGELEFHPTRANTVNLPGTQSSVAPPSDTTNPRYHHSMGEHNRHPLQKAVHISVETESYVMKDFDSESPEPVHDKGREEILVV